MTRSEFIAGRLREVLLDGRWIAYTNYKELLLNTSWQQAIAKVADLNTIAALTYHINYYLDGILNVLTGGDLEIQDKYSFDLPLIKSGKDWMLLRDTFLINAEKFVSAIEEMPDEKLDEVFIDRKYGTYLRNIEGVIEHSYYHMGQISLLKRLLPDMPEVTGPQAFPSET